MTASSCDYVLLLGDIHANQEALRVVMSDVSWRYRGRRLVTWFLGDLFGRGPQPITTWQMLAQFQPEAAIVGNHDWGLLGRSKNINVNEASSGAANERWDGPFKPHEWQVILAHRRELAEGLLLKLNGVEEVAGGTIADYLSALPIVFSPRPSIYLVHGGLEHPFTPPRDLPTLLDRIVWDYVKEAQHCEYTFTALRWLYENRPSSPEVMAGGGQWREPQLIIVGHYHRRILYRKGAEGWEFQIRLDQPYELQPHPERPVLISPGSVGFPREDGDRDASYAVLCWHEGQAYSVTFHKVSFDRVTVQTSMKDKGYPPEIIQRLSLPGEDKNVR